MAGLESKVYSTSTSTAAFVMNWVMTLPQPENPETPVAVALRAIVPPPMNGASPAPVMNATWLSAWFSPTNEMPDEPSKSISPSNTPKVGGFRISSNVESSTPAVVSRVTSAAHTRLTSHVDDGAKFSTCIEPVSSVSNVIFTWVSVPFTASNWSNTSGSGEPGGVSQSVGVAGIESVCVSLNVAADANGSARSKAMAATKAKTTTISGFACFQFDLGIDNPCSAQFRQSASLSSAAAPVD